MPICLAHSERDKVHFRPSPLRSERSGHRHTVSHPSIFGRPSPMTDRSLKRTIGPFCTFQPAVTITRDRRDAKELVDLLDVGKPKSRRDVGVGVRLASVTTCYSQKKYDHPEVPVGLLSRKESGLIAIEVLSQPGNRPFSNISTV